jgi:hypothetical protein
MFDLEQQINSWSNHLRARGNVTESDVRELENHLRDEIDDLISAGLTADEAFLISVKRLGNVDAIAQEYSKVNTENLWKQLMLDPIDPETHRQNRRGIVLVIIFTLLAGTLFKIPEFFGIKLFDPAADLFYFKNIGCFVLPFIAGFFLINRKADRKTAVVIMGIFVLSALVVNLYPSYTPQQTEFLTGLHLPLFLWLIAGVAYIGQEWRTNRERMNFIRFTGETFIYGVLISCGVMVLAMFTQVIFEAIQIDAGDFVQGYVLVYGGCAAVLITVYLAEAKKSIVENFAPILAKIFSPLFLITMCVFLAVMIITGQSPFIERDFLIAFDFMLALVLGLVLYVISARDINAHTNLFDYLNLALILIALIIDTIALSAIIFRLSAYGITPNKLAALGENLILLGNLGGLAWLYIGYFRKKHDFIRLEMWQTAYLYVFLIWTAFVAFIFPVTFGFR